MTLPRALARLNRRILNRFMAVLAPYPPFGALVHRGRKSGREYRIVLNAYPCRDGFLMALPYGRDSDWVKNVLANEVAELVYRRRRVHLHRPRLVDEAEARPCLPAVARAAYRALGVGDFLMLERAGGEAA